MLYSRPFLYSHDSYWEFIAALTKNPRLAHALHHPSIVFHARAVLPFSPSRQTEHWWQKRRNTGRLTRGATAGLAKVLVLCSNLQGVTYYSRQREVSYELPPDLFNNSCVGRTMTLAACLQDGLAFPPACTLTTIEELCITGVRLVRCLPHLPKLRSLVLAKCKLDPTHFSGPLFRSEDHSQCIQHIQLLANDKDVVALLANVVTGRSTIEGLALVGEHEVVALDSFFGNLKLLSSLTKLILDSRGSAALYATGRSMPFFRTLVLVILGATSNVTSHLVALANLIESGRCPYLEEISVNNYSVASYAEEANVIALNRMEAWCNYHHSAIKVLQIRTWKLPSSTKHDLHTTGTPGEPQSEREWIHAHLTGLRKAGGHW